MLEDSEYKDAAAAHRGQFAEQYAAQRLKSVFGNDSVHTNLIFTDKSGNRAGEIDVLVHFLDRAIILQSKTKRLTIASRKGNDNAIQDDFKKGIQDAYDQGKSCAALLCDPNYGIVDETGRTIKLRRNFKEIYIFCVVSDHYPSLSYQARRFLKFEATEQVPAPFITDVFFLDTLCEMLNTPFHFLNFIHRRIMYFDRVIANNDHAVLAFHLTQNLWIDKENNIVHIADDFSHHLDAAMYVRREGVPGKDTPEGLLTKFRGHPFESLVKLLEMSYGDGLLDVFYFLMELNEATTKDVGGKFFQLINQSRYDDKRHDMTVAAGDGGLTIHSAASPRNLSEMALSTHCKVRKYSCKARRWYGLAVNASNVHVIFAIIGDFVWEPSAEMDEALRKFNSLSRGNASSLRTKSGGVGRNDPCPCGSGKKYKKCCLPLSRPW